MIYSLYFQPQTKQKYKTSENDSSPIVPLELPPGEESPEPSRPTSANTEQGNLAEGFFYLEKKYFITKLASVLIIDNYVRE